MDWTNHFLETLPPEDRDRLRGGLTLVGLERDEVLAEQGAEVRTAYLPVTAICSVVTVMSDGRRVESRTIGRESAFGLLHALGSPLSFEEVTVQVSGEAWATPLHFLRSAAKERPSLVACIAQHAQATMVQAGRGTACNAIHSAEQRLCRWLLLTRDRIGSDILPLKQEHLAIMLGVQRTTVTALASALQEQGLISYSRGRITLRDPGRIEACACECYELMEMVSARLTGRPPADLIQSA